jgi:hypothetical protein
MKITVDLNGTHPTMEQRRRHFHGPHVAAAVPLSVLYVAISKVRQIWRTHLMKDKWMAFHFLPLK